jgi:pimeloyl-ACP methyl ester carboxylesterase
VGKGSLASFWTSSSNLLLIHGFSSDARSYTGASNLLAGLWASYANIVTYQYRSAFSVADHAAWLRAQILENAAAGFKTDIVAHSMGGLVARWMVEALGGVEDKIGKLVMIATPHLGSPWALLAQAYDDIPDLPDSASEYFPGLLDLLPTPSGAGPLLNAVYGDNAVDYFLIAGVRLDLPLLGLGDGVVLVASALGLPSLALSEAATVFPPSGPPGADWSHRNLLKKAADNGVLAQVLVWLGP